MIFLNEVPLRTPLCPGSLLTDRTLTWTVDYVMVRVCEVLVKAADYTRENSEQCNDRLNTLRTGSFKLFKRPFPGFLTILTL
jgi:hypothetical protein